MDSSKYIEKVAHGWSHVIDFDNQILSDKKRFSHWLLGLATAGFILVIGQVGEVAGECSSRSINCILIPAAAFIFLVSLIGGGSIVYYINKKLECQRMYSTIIMRQELDIMRKLPKLDINLKNFIEDLQGGRHLDGERRRRFKKNQENSKKFSKRIKFCLLLQPCLTIGGYMSILIIYVLDKCLK